MEIVHTTCPKCDADIEVLVEINESTDCPENCSECSYKFTDIEYTKMVANAQIDAIGKLTDQAADRNR